MKQRQKDVESQNQLLGEINHLLQGIRVDMAESLRNGIRCDLQVRRPVACQTDLDEAGGEFNLRNDADQKWTNVKKGGEGWVIRKIERKGSAPYLSALTRSHLTTGYEFVQATAAAPAPHHERPVQYSGRGHRRP